MQVLRTYHHRSQRDMMGSWFRQRRTKRNCRRLSYGKRRLVLRCLFEGTTFQAHFETIFTKKSFRIAAHENMR